MCNQADLSYHLYPYSNGMQSAQKQLPRHLPLPSCVPLVASVPKGPSGRGGVRGGVSNFPVLDDSRSEQKRVGKIGNAPRHLNPYSNGMRSEHEHSMKEHGECLS